VSADRARSRDARPAAEGAQVALTSAHDRRDADLADFHTRILSIDGRSIVHVSGELDAHNAARLRDSLWGLISAGSRHIVVDLADVSFMGAGGLGVLVGAGKRLRRDDGMLLLRSAPPSVQKMIEITGLDATLPRT
jgi:anti-sigma B factor antagonist